MSVRRMRALGALVGVVIAGLLVILATRPRDTISNTADLVFPSSLSRMVEASSAIIVGRYVESSGFGSNTLATAPQASAGQPNLETGMVATRIVVDDVLKSNGAITATQSITYVVAGDMPLGQTMIAIDSTAGFPHLWPVDTEFVLFLDQEEGADWYYITGGVCGRIVTSGDEVTCSDGALSIPDFMDGVDGKAFIAAVEKVVESASPTGASSSD